VQKPEIRRDPVVARWVIIAAARGERPDFFRARPAELTGEPCPFCPGHESATPAAVLTSPVHGTDPARWQVRVVPNKYPALEPEGDLDKLRTGLYQRMNGVGIHEVIIESPSHDATFATMPLDHLAAVLAVYRQRILALKGDSRAHYIQVFKNDGQAAGATLDHPHTQVIAMPFIPRLIVEELRGSEAHYARTGRCVYCELLATEMTDRTRIVTESEHHVALTPYASRFPFETWVFPKRHAAAFESISQGAIPDLASILQDVMKGLIAALDGPAYNFLLHSAPMAQEDSVHYHWHMEIMPRTTQMAGFEWGTGCYINPTSPEEAARVLRGILGA
jgi:UDPglucose--hexose-1-phosphate uridylyltransferase